MKTKKVIAALMAMPMMVGMLAGCGESEATENGKEGAESAATEVSDGVASDLVGTKITFMNSKGEVQEALEEMAETFEEETGIEVEVQLCPTGDTPYTKIISAYTAGKAPTMAMLDPGDVITLAEEYAVNLSEEAWNAECGEQTITIDGITYGFPFCIEGRGLIYNKTTIEETLGREFEPSSINSYDALAALLEELRAAGMENPVVVSKEDWSLGNHQLGYIYDSYDGTTAGSTELISQLKDGMRSVADYDRYDMFLNTLDLLLEYNINGDDPLGALYDQDPIFLVDGEAAIWANGNWAWPNLAEAGASTDDEYGFLPYVFGNDVNDIANTKIQAGATKQIMIDRVQATEEEIAAAKEFLNWLVYSDNGQKMLVESAGVIPACTNNAYMVVDPLGKDIQTKMAEGKTYPSVFIAPGDHWSVLGGSMQKYLVGENTRETLAEEIDEYWMSQE